MEDLTKLPTGREKERRKWSIADPASPGAERGGDPEVLDTTAP
jgi:hypothetical protein